MKRILLGKGEHWLLLVVFAAGFYVMGGRHLHVRAFVPFTMILLGLVVLSLGFIVWRYRPGDVVTREPFEDAALPHGGRRDDEV